MRLTEAELRELLREIEPTVAKHGSEVVLYCGNGSDAEKLFEALETAVCEPVPTLSEAGRSALARSHGGEDV